MERRAFLGTASAAILFSRAAFADSRPIASTKYGRIRGLVNSGINVFKGIPYGAPTSGKDRFHPPLPPKPWSYVRDAVEFTPEAPQSTDHYAGDLQFSWTLQNYVSEDCLGLNVWTAGLRDGKKRPVMVWHHGGGFTKGSGCRNVYDGTRLARHGDVVVVTHNHRLNAFGYLYLGDLAPSFGPTANVGMLDILAVLRWVKDNIAEFGGDPDNVTIFGQSGGGGKVSTLMAMPDAEGLFHKAIIESGARNSAMSPAEATISAKAYLAKLGLKPSDATKLSELPLQTLRDAEEATKANWGPVVDGHILPASPFYPNVAKAVSSKVPLLLGTNETETAGTLGAPDPSLFNLSESGLRDRLKEYLDPAGITSLVSFYQKKRPTASPSEVFFVITTTLTMRRNAWMVADAKSILNAAPVYLYELDWHTPVDGGRWMSPHSLEESFVFDNVAVSESFVGTGPEPQRMADQMSAAWVSFAHTGDPSTPSLRWPAYDTTKRNTMVFNIQSKVMPDFRGDERNQLAQVHKGVI